MMLGSFGFDGARDHFERQNPFSIECDCPVSFNQWLVLRPIGHLDSIESHELGLVVEANPLLALGYQLGEEFQQIVAHRDVEAFEQVDSESSAFRIEAFPVPRQGHES